MVHHGTPQGHSAEDAARERLHVRMGRQYVSQFWSAVRISFCAKASCRMRDDIPGRRPAICGLALAHWGAESDIK